MVGRAEDLEFTVLARTPRTSNIVELELCPAGGRLVYQPGQYVLICDRGHTVPARSYSVANAPDPLGRISLLVTDVPGGETSAWIHRGLHVGEGLLVSGPYGTFVADPTSQAPVLCLAAGSGLAPIRALAQDAVPCAGAEWFTVLFFARTPAGVLDRERFASWQRKCSGFRFESILTEQAGEPPQGRSPVPLPARFGDLSGHEVFVAGAPGFVADCVLAARALGVRPGHLHTEEFFEDPRPWNAPVAARVDR
jgi:CDP-4-dehydro-6-deoxyglucose reductase